MEERSPAIRLIAGLGNPGPEYARTRHNVGFMVLDELATGSTDGWESSGRWGGWLIKGPVMLFKPATYMNRSGTPVAQLARFFKIAAEEILVVIDDLALPLGRVRLRLSGSSGGHNGLESILNCLGTDQVPRLRVGIGAAPREGAVDHVLGRFFEEERPQLEKGIGRAAEAANHASRHGVVAAMNIFNKAEVPNNEESI